MHKLVAALLAAIALAGCAGADGEASPAAGPGAGGMGHGEHAGLDPGAHLLAPEHQLGDWWRWDSPQIADPYTSVLAADNGAEWVVATDNPEIAFFDARFDVASQGPARKSDMAGSQGSERVAFFAFPLTEGKTWSTTWDGEPMSIKALKVAGGVADIEARRADGTLYAAYTYDASLGYFGQIAYYDPTGATVGFEARVTGSGDNFTGDLLRWTLEVEYETHGPITPGLVGFDVDTGITDVWVDFHVACSAGAVSINVGALTGIQQERGYSVNGPCPAAVSQTFTLPPPAQDDEAWGAAIAVAPQATQGTLDIIVLSRTATLFKVGQVPA